ncbi:MAG: hypothetical protein EOP06_06045 [Proteobacteria bacterium]|nr:MAG: hypothetical protein EOP06_06045 [Pseudomonadota bacterium]
MSLLHWFYIKIQITNIAAVDSGLLKELVKCSHAGITVGTPFFTGAHEVMINVALNSAAELSRDRRVALMIDLVGKVYGKFCEIGISHAVVTFDDVTESSFRLGQQFIRHALPVAGSEVIDKDFSHTLKVIHELSYELVKNMGFHAHRLYDDGLNVKITLLNLSGDLATLTSRELNSLPSLKHTYIAAISLHRGISEPLMKKTFATSDERLSVAIVSSILRLELMHDLTSLSVNKNNKYIRVEG